MLDEIIKIMKAIFEMEPDEELLPESTQQEISGWDSLTQMELVSELEKRFDVEFDFMDLVKMDSPAEIERIIKEKRKIRG